MRGDIVGNVNGVAFRINKKLVEKLKRVHNIDAIKEINDALMNNITERVKDANQSNAGESTSN
jgi:hypothetical protein